MKTNKLNISERARNGRNGVQLVYILDCIRESSRATDEGMTFETDFDALKFFFDCFNQEFNHTYNKRLFPCLSDRIGAYLRGLPSCCNIDYWNDSILKLGLMWGVIDSMEGRKAEKFVNNFFEVCGLRICQAAQKVGLNPYQFAV